MRKNGIADYTFENGTLKWMGPAGEMVAYTIPKFDKYSPFIQSALHNGFKQKIADSMAIEDATVSEKFAAATECVERLNAGEWIAKRESGNTILFRALCELAPKRDRGEIKVWIAGQSPKFLRKFVRLPNVAEKIAELRAQTVPDAETEKALAELMS